VKAGLGTQVGAAAQAARHGLTWDQYIEQGYLVAGDPGQVIEGLKDVAERLRVGQMMVLLQIGSMPPDLAERNIRRFAQDVLPEIKKLWPEHEDFWTPQATGGHWREPRRVPAGVS
jgi:alkanesulfonate monooxygenase SsuD/methylene tetrahydromethanopterin reductase-like flavin-dependent oxidoreductase (luciferase family)